MDTISIESIIVAVILMIVVFLPMNHTLKARNKFEKALKDNHEEEWKKLREPSEGKWPFTESPDDKIRKYLQKREYEHLNNKTINELGRKAHAASYYPIFGAMLGFCFLMAFAFFPS